MSADETALLAERLVNQTLLISVKCARWDRWVLGTYALDAKAHADDLLAAVVGWKPEIDARKALAAAEAARDAERALADALAEDLPVILTALERSSPPDPGYGELKFRQDCMERGKAALAAWRQARGDA